MTDPIADMLTRIRNAALARRSSLSMPHSKMKAAIAEILKSSGYIKSFKVTGELPKQIEIELPETTIATTISRISKPGRRIYAASSEIPQVLGGRGIVIISTSAGVMTGKEARKLGLGGELICKVY